MIFKDFVKQSDKKDVEKAIKKLPEKHKKLIKDYTLKFEEEFTLKKDPNHIGLIDEKNKLIIIASPWHYSREFTMFHEIAHAVWKYIVKKEEKKEWSKILENTKNKQNQNNEELFCMAYANYYSKHKVEIHNHKSWNEFIKKI